MLAPSALRRLATGPLSALLAVLFVLARMMTGPGAMAAPTTDSALAALAAVSVLCHTGLDGVTDRGAVPADGADHHDSECLSCPACHVASQPGLLAPLPASLPASAGGVIDRIGVLPPATAPPRAERRATPPTGPPTRSV